jgi:hypothetical protein
VRQSVIIETPPLISRKFKIQSRFAGHRGKQTDVRRPSSQVVLNVAALLIRPRDRRLTIREPLSGEEFTAAEPRDSESMTLFVDQLGAPEDVIDVHFPTPFADGALWATRRRFVKR